MIYAVMNFRDLDRLQRRIEKVRVKKEPPRLKCLVIQDGEEVPEVNDPFTLLIQIEGKGENNK
tara:strand:- start:315 stop:503 length:189 start_codon:yes stop_codon:yes gene_type:complete